MKILLQARNLNDCFLGCSVPQVRNQLSPRFGNMGDKSKQVGLPARIIVKVDDYPKYLKKRWCAKCIQTKMFFQPINRYRTIEYTDNIYGDDDFVE